MEQDPEKELKQPTTEAQDQAALASNNQMNGELIAAAHEQAEHDMEEDAELTASSPNDDLDEGETARLGEDDTLLV